jgi:poly-beta-1,6-N-acetyl-D-glucosamine synthase
MPGSWIRCAVAWSDTGGWVFTMKILFWTCFSLIAYAYVGYMMWLWLTLRLHKRPIVKGKITPTVSILIAARNEEANLTRKLENLRQLHYPADKIQTIVASDGSTDRTAEILSRWSPDVIPVILLQAQGKANALNEAARRATGEILVFLDVRQSVDPDALAELVSCFADPGVGAVSGELLLDAEPGASHVNALGIYWKIEKMVRKLESASGSVVGVTGAIYAIRRKLYVEIPAGTILDDVFVPMNVVRLGSRVVFQPTAIARDRLFSEKGKEFSRKVRTLTGNYQLLRLAPWLISPQNPLLFRFFSHKVLRLLVPILMVAMLAACIATGGQLYRILLWLQIAFYVLAALGTFSITLRRLKPIAIASTFVTLNAAAAVALYNFVTRKNAVWIR